MGHERVFLAVAAMVVATLPGTDCFTSFAAHPSEAPALARRGAGLAGKQHRQTVRGNRGNNGRGLVPKLGMLSSFDDGGNESQRAERREEERKEAPNHRVRRGVVQRRRRRQQRPDVQHQPAVFHPMLAGLEAAMQGGGQVMPLEGTSDVGGDVDVLLSVGSGEAGAAAELLSEQQVRDMKDEQMELRRRLSHLHVLIFNAGKQDEGLYTLWLEDRNIVLGFESEEDAVRYGVELRAQHFFAPAPERMCTEDLLSFCQSAGVGLEIAPQGAGIVPPKVNKPTLKVRTDVSSSDLSTED